MSDWAVGYSVSASQRAGLRFVLRVILSPKRRRRRKAAEDSYGAKGTTARMEACVQKAVPLHGRFESPRSATGDVSTTPPFLDTSLPRCLIWPPLSTRYRGTAVYRHTEASPAAFFAPCCRWCIRFGQLRRGRVSIISAGRLVADTSASVYANPSLTASFLLGELGEVSSFLASKRPRKFV